MSVKRFRVISVLCLAAVILLSAAATILIPHFASLQSAKPASGTAAASGTRTVAWDGVPENWYYNTPLSLSGVAGYYNESKYRVSITVKQPDNSTQAIIGTSYTPKMTGKHVFTASANIEGVATTDTFELMVDYGATSLLDGFYKIDSIKDGVDFPDYAAYTAKGIALSGQPGAAFWYSKTIDVSNLTKYDEIISLQVDASVPNSTLNALTIKLVDAHDETNTIALKFRDANSTSDFACYTVGQFGSYSAGIWNGATNPLYGWYNGRPESEYGTTVGGITFKGNLYDRSGINSFNMRFDAGEQALYTNTSYTIPSWSGLLKILPLSDTHLLPKPWKGFTGHHAYLKIEFTSGGGTVVVDKIMGESLSASTINKPKNDGILLFKKEKDFTSSLHDGAVGYVYPLPENIPYNRFIGDLDVQRALYKVEGQTETDVSDKITGNSFTPTAAGDYVLRFSTTDQFKSIVTREFTFAISASPQPIVFPTSLESSYSAISVLQRYEAPALNITGGAGQLDINYYFIFNGDKSDTAPGGQLFIDSPGTLQLKVKAIDGIGFEAEKIYNIIVDDDVQVLQGGGVPRSLPANTKITMPIFTALNYLGAPAGSQGNFMTVKTYVGSAQLSTDLSYTTPASGSITLRYVAGEGTPQQIAEEFIIKIIAQDITAEGYFIQWVEDSGYSQAVVFSHGVEFKAAPKNGGADQSIGFAYPVAADEAYLMFSLLKEQNSGINFITIRFTDYYDNDNVLEFSIGELFTASPSIWINGILTKNTMLFSDNTYPTSATASYRGKSYRTFTVSYNSLYRQFFTVGNVPAAKADTRLDGLPFNGFSDAVLIDIFTSGADKTNSVIINTVCNTDFNTDLTGDYRGPTVNFSTPVVINQTVSINTEHTFPAAQAYDVLQYLATDVKLTVYAPDGTVIARDILAAQGYTVTLSAYGSYTAVYIVEDLSGNETKKTVIVTVKDFEPPTISGGNVAKTAKLGEKLSIPVLTVTDNVDAAPILFMYLSRPDGSRVVLTGGEEYFINIKGLHILNVYARDSAGNTTFSIYQISVS